MQNASPLNYHLKTWDITWHTTFKPNFKKLKLNKIIMVSFYLLEQNCKNENVWPVSLNTTSKSKNIVKQYDKIIHQNTSILIKQIYMLTKYLLN
jgi:hypothetical protein